MLSTWMGRIRIWLQCICNRHIHKRSCQVALPYRMGPNTKIHFSKGDLCIGSGLNTKRNVYLAVTNNGHMRIGRDVFFNQNCIVICREQISIGDGCKIGPNVCMYDHDHRFDQDGIYPDYRSSPITIGKGCWIGAGVMILRGTTVGDGCVIGAGTVVKGDIPPHSLVTSGRDMKITPMGSR